MDASFARFSISPRFALNTRITLWPGWPTKHFAKLSVFTNAVYKRRRFMLGAHHQHSHSAQNQQTNSKVFCGLMGDLHSGDLYVQVSAVTGVEASCPLGNQAARR